MTTTSLAVAIRQAADAFSRLSSTPRLDAELLAAFAMGMPRGEMLMKMHDVAEPSTFAALSARRSAHEPVAYITGTQAFWDLELSVTPDVLIPRSDSETLIEAALSGFADRAEPERILDIGTGSGALLLAALSAFSNARGVGIDSSSGALRVAQDNAARLGFADRVQCLQLDWHDKDWSADMAHQFDLILCNPPYVETDANLEKQVAEYEPGGALFAGHDGLDDYLAIIPALPALLAQNGVAILEIGASQARVVTDLAHNAEFAVQLRHDLSGNPRCLTCRLP